MTSIRLVDFRQQRHVKRCKKFFVDAVDCVQDINCQVAGYAVIVWDDAGTASVAYHTGGPVLSGGLTSYVIQKLDIRPSDREHREP